MRIGWNTGGGRVCCGTCHRCCVSPGTAVALVGWPTLFSYSPWASPSSPSCVSSRKNFWTASASLKSGGSESPALSLAGFYFFVLSACSWSWGHSGAPHPRAAMVLTRPPSPSSLHRGAICAAGPPPKSLSPRGLGSWCAPQSPHPPGGMCPLESFLKAACFAQIFTSTFCWHSPSILLSRFCLFIVLVT